MSPDTPQRPARRKRKPATEQQGRDNMADLFAEVFQPFGVKVIRQGPAKRKRPEAR